MQKAPLMPLTAPDDLHLSGSVSPLGQTESTGRHYRAVPRRWRTEAQYLDLLRAKNIDPGSTVKDFTPWNVSQSLL